MEFRLNNEPRATSHSDVWVRDVPMAVRRQISDAAEKCKASGPDEVRDDMIAEFVALLFRHVIVDQNGSAYSNIQCANDVLHMGVERLLEVQDAVMEVMAPGKPSPKTGPSRPKSTSSSRASRRVK